MDTNSMELLVEALASNKDISSKLLVVLRERIDALDSVSLLDPAMPNIGLQALAQRKAVALLRELESELDIEKRTPRTAMSYK